MDRPSPPLLRGQLTYLRPHERSEIPLFVRWFNDQETSHFLSMRSPMSQASEEQWFEHMLEAQGKTAYNFTICLLEDDRPIGTIALMDVDHVDGNAAVGISIGEKELWGQGYGTDAMNALLDFGFGQIRMERIWLEVYDYNARGMRSYEKCGFVLEGTLRHAIFREGSFRDVHIMSILHHEWLAQERQRTWEHTTY